MSGRNDASPQIRWNSGADGIVRMKEG